MYQKRKCYIFATLVLSLIFLIFSSNLNALESMAASPVVIKNTKSILDFSGEHTARAHNEAKNPTLPVLSQANFINKPVALAPVLPFEIHTDGDLATCEKTVSSALSVLPRDHVLGLETINLTGKKMDRRGYGGYGSIDLQCVDMDETELIGVLIHEMGHIADTNFLMGGNNVASVFIDYNRYLSSDDESVDFYAISWVDSSQMKRDATKMNFVSLYAMTNPFEDFAETYAMYVLHGGQFKKMAEKNNVLAEKYNFMKNNVFFGREFENDSAYMNSAVRVYDSTRMKFSLAKFLGK